jgi:hypothetical protein
MKAVEGAKRTLNKWDFQNVGVTILFSNLHCKISYPLCSIFKKYLLGYSHPLQKSIFISEIHSIYHKAHFHIFHPILPTSFKIKMSFYNTLIDQWSLCFPLFSTFLAHQLLGVRGNPLKESLFSRFWRPSCIRIQKLATYSGK